VRHAHRATPPPIMQTLTLAKAAVFLKTSEETVSARACPSWNELLK
jgi:hypothetical protein